MSHELTTEQAEAILEGLTKQAFYNWYTGDFEAYIAGDEDALPKQRMLEDIKDLFWKLGDQLAK